MHNTTANILKQKETMYQDVGEADDPLRKANSNTNKQSNAATTTKQAPPPVLEASTPKSVLKKTPSQSKMKPRMSIFNLFGLNGIKSTDDHFEEMFDSVPQLMPVQPNNVAATTTTALIGANINNAVNAAAMTPASATPAKPQPQVVDCDISSNVDINYKDGSRYFGDVGQTGKVFCYYLWKMTIYCRNMARG